VGYDLYITRKDWCANPEGPVISLEEWVAFAGTSSEVAPGPQNPGERNWVMRGHSKRSPLWWFDGHIRTKNPDGEAIAVMVRIARALDARVLGEDDEVYGTDPANPSAFVRQ
jgi:prepilin-type processing-associated H-X9-DG protein